MTRLRRSLLALALAPSAIALAGCGGSGRSASAPGGTGTTGAIQVLPPATPITSPAYRAFAQRGLARIPGVPKSAIPRIVNCVIQKQVSQGITTVGAIRDHPSEVNADGVACAHEAGLH